MTRGYYNLNSHLNGHLKTGNDEALHSLSDRDDERKERRASNMSIQVIGGLLGTLIAHLRTIRYPTDDIS
jgi:hypothetical protein